ncbi:MAG: exo-alpha-sialidase [Chloroflexi bacterium]|nr:exo-alpha-sialidase [Chloroflexota bacterium]
MDSYTLIDQDLARGILTIDQAALYKVYAIFKSPRLPFQYQSAVPIPLEGLDAVMDAVANWVDLNETTRQTINDYLTPKDITTSSIPGTLASKRVPGMAMQIPLGQHFLDCDLYVKPTPHFSIFYSTTGLCATSDAYVNILATGLEDAWTRYSALGYTMPPLGTFVWVIPIHLRSSVPAMSPRSLILFDNSMHVANVQVTAAHEFFHIVQWQYFGNEITCPGILSDFIWAMPRAWQNYDDVRWWMEATAQWAQHEVYGNDQSYFAFISSYLNQPWTHLDTSPKLIPNFAYGSVLFPIYLSERMPAGRDVVRAAWSRYVQMNNACGPMMPALQSALQTQNTTMEQVFPSFSGANYTLDYQNQNQFRNTPIIGVGPDFRPNPWSHSLNDQTLAVSGPVRTDGGQQIEHLAATYIEVRNDFVGSIGRTLTVTVDIYIPGPNPGVKLWAVKQFTPTLDATMITPNLEMLGWVGGNQHYVARATVLNFDSYKWVAMALVNPLTSGSSAMTYTYSAGVVPPPVIYAGGNLKGFVSTNGGAMWNSFEFPNNVDVQAVAAVTNTQGLVGYMGTSDLRLWKTTNGGQAFNTAYDFVPKVQGIIGNAVFSMITIDPVNANTVYVGIHGKTDPYWGPDKGALFKSTDGGQTFGSDLLADCHANHNPGDWYDCAITSLAIDPRNPNVLWIGQDAWNSVGQAVMRSTDGGQTWQSMLGDMIDTFTGISLSPVNSNVLWAIAQQQLSGQYVYHTADGGATWNAAKIDNTLNPGNRFVLADPLNVKAAWASGGQEGLKRGQDGNVNWTRINSPFHALAAMNSQWLYGVPEGPQGAASVQVSTDGGITWFDIGDPAMSGLSGYVKPQPLSVVLP